MGPDMYSYEYSSTRVLSLRFFKFGESRFWQAIRHTIRTQIIGPCARTLELPLLVRSGVFYFLFVSGSRLFGVFVNPPPEKEVLDYPEHGPNIRVLTVVIRYSVEWLESVSRRGCVERGTV